MIANLMLLLTKTHQPKADSTPSAPSFFSEFKLGWKAFIQEKPIVLLTVGTAIFDIAFMPLPTLFPFMTCRISAAAATARAWSNPYSVSRRDPVVYARFPLERHFVYLLKFGWNRPHLRSYRGH
ncbi:hypothetical protein [Paenibacillus sp. V4I5]|uniref:hypothetical protein n=1 Tax=Paenibacillus sp. V4I5 TaxID=3042306 RepID=UPI00278E7715|nr:hypothetical protein [Paenibacillus sp. V4I5]MDQ0919508.1 hypothetical protein [Paenibacillus sp. V4I5]